MSTNGQELVSRSDRENVGLVHPVASAADVAGMHREVTELIKHALVEGEDYGVIPGTEKTDREGRDISKRVLFKPGAERLCVAFGASPKFEVVTQEVDHDRVVKFTKRRFEWGQRRGEKVWHSEDGESLGLYRYVVRCSIERPDGRVLAQGLGSCSTLESKYVDRPRDSENTVLKMAKKRALVDAVLTMAGLSGRFTQDVEDSDGGGGPPRRATHDHPSDVGSGAGRTGKEPAEGAAYQPPLSPPTKTGRSTIEQKRRFFADARTRLRWDDEKIKQWLLMMADCESTSDVTETKMSELITQLEQVQVT